MNPLIQVHIDHLNNYVDGIMWVEELEGMELYRLWMGEDILYGFCNEEMLNNYLIALNVKMLEILKGH